MLDRGDASLGDAHTRSYSGLGDARVSRGGVEHPTRASMVTLWPVMQYRAGPSPSGPLICVMPA